MNLLLMSLALGIAVGWAGSLWSREHSVWGLDMNSVFGMAGALTGSYLLRPMMGAELGSDGLDLLSLLAAVLGAIVGVTAWLGLRTHGGRPK